MVSRSELEVAVRSMVAYDILSKPLISLGHKADRRKEKAAGEIATLLSENGEAERVVARIERREEEKARTMREGIEAFKERFQNYGKILEGLIQEKRVESNQYLVYGLAEGYKLSVEDYRRVMRDIGMTPLEADGMYAHLLDISERLGKAKENVERSILL